MTNPDSHEGVKELEHLTRDRILKNKSIKKISVPHKNTVGLARVLFGGVRSGESTKSLFHLLFFFSFFLFFPPNRNALFIYFPHFEASGFQFDFEIHKPAFQIKPKPRLSEEFSSREMGKSGFFFFFSSFFDIFLFEDISEIQFSRPGGAGVSELGCYLPGIGVAHCYKKTQKTLHFFVLHAGDYRYPGNL